MDAVSQQCEYYTRTARHYEFMHGDEPEHEFALTFLSSVLSYFSASSLLDVGSGTGRVIRRLKSEPRHQHLKMTGVEPVAALREQAYSLGVQPDEIIDGDANKLQFEAGSFDFVCVFGVLHHVAKPGRIINEMLRVAKRGIFISDMNNFGCGRLPERVVKQFINALGLWRVFQLIKTRGKGYKYSEGDGIHYSFSVYDHYKQLSAVCANVFILNTNGKGRNPYRACSHVALVGMKRSRDA
jgi:ubiquinone/menaquinone biosynthesis C-methylase UbiE